MFYPLVPWYAAVFSVAAGLTSAPISLAIADDRSPVEIDTVREGGVLVLEDGRSVCLPGLWVPGAASGRMASAVWRSAWRDIVEQRGFVWSSDGAPSSNGSPERNRYDCPLGHLATVDGVSLQTVLLEAGWGAVEPVTAPFDDTSLENMLALEEEARRAGRGIWKLPEALPKTVDALDDWIGTRQIVEGSVQRVHENDRYAYLNFGADWRTDFTVRLHRKMIDEEGLDMSTFDAKRLRVRGVLQQSRGPLIDISHLKQIEFLP